MNIVVKYFTFTPTLFKYLRGVLLFRRGNFTNALTKFEQCIKHPSFQNKLMYSYYGQTLCALGRLKEGHLYIIKACINYEKQNWSFENDYAANLAKNTISALEHTLKHLDLVEGKEYIGKNVIINIK